LLRRSTIVFRRALTAVVSCPNETATASHNFTGEISRIASAIASVCKKGLWACCARTASSSQSSREGLARASRRKELSGSIQTLQNLPGSLPWVLDRTAEHYDAEFVLIDMSPGLGAINQNLFTTSDFFIVPTNPDFFSVMAIDSLSTVIPRWQDWARRAAENPVLQDAAYPFPKPQARFLGTVVQKFRPRRGTPSAAFAQWIVEIQERIDTLLIPALEQSGMLLDRELYGRCGLEADFTLGVIADFNSLIAASQTHQTPIYALSAEQIGKAGVVLEAAEQSRDEFRSAFEAMAEKVCCLIES